jgi:hypothetical protein
MSEKYKFAPGVLDDNSEEVVRSVKSCLDKGSTVNKFPTIEELRDPKVKAGKPYKTLKLNDDGVYDWAPYEETEDKLTQEERDTIMENTGKVVELNSSPKGLKKFTSEEIDELLKKDPEAEKILLSEFEKCKTWDEVFALKEKYGLI